MRTHWMKMMVDRSVLASWWLDKIKSWMGDWKMPEDKNGIRRDGEKKGG
jgi:hypothetical protein